MSEITGEYEDEDGSGKLRDRAVYEETETESRWNYDTELLLTCQQKEKLNMQGRNLYFRPLQHVHTVFFYVL